MKLKLREIVFIGAAIILICSSFFAFYSIVQMNPYEGSGNNKNKLVFMKSNIHTSQDTISGEFNNIKINKTNNISYINISWESPMTTDLKEGEVRYSYDHSRLINMNISIRDNTLLIDAKSDFNDQAIVKTYLELSINPNDAVKLGLADINDLNSQDMIISNAIRSFEPKFSSDLNDLIGKENINKFKSIVDSKFDKKKFLDSLYNDDENYDSDDLESNAYYNFEQNYYDSNENNTTINTSETKDTIIKGGTND